MSEPPLTIESDDALEKRAEEAQTALSRLRARLDALMGSLGGGVAALRMEQTADLSRHGRPDLRLTEPSRDPGEAAAYDAVRTSILFDRAWYLAANADVREAGADPAMHYVMFGAREGRAPGPAFDGVAYLAAHPDVAATGINPLHHYESAGRAEGRLLATAGPQAPGNAFVVRDRPLRIVAGLTGFAEYEAFVAACPEAFAAATEEAVKDHARLHGTTTRLLGAMPADQTVILGDDMREHLISGGVSSRVRAVSEIIYEAVDHLNLTEQSARIYGHEGITPFAQMMRARFPRFIGTEYAPSPADEERIFPITHNDVCASRFADEAFDIAFSCDVFEHVYDRDRLLGEAARTLRPGGWFIATFPFDHDIATGWLFAEVVDGEIRHLLETPIYHGNPMDEGGSLVFEIVGWDIVARALAAGFSHAEMRFVCDQQQGVVGSAMGRVTQPRGIFVFVGRK